MCKSYLEMPNPLSPNIDMDPIPDKFPKRCMKDCPLGKPLDENGEGVTPNGDWSRMHRLLIKLALGYKRNLTVVYLGGSMTTGKMMHYREFPNDHSLMNSNWYLKCNSTCLGDPPYGGELALNNVCPTCAYSARFEYWLKQAYPDIDIISHNIAIGGSTSLSQLGVIIPTLAAIPHVDVYFMHYTDNDGNANTPIENIPPIRIAGFEYLVRYLLTRYHQTAAVINIESACLTCNTGAITDIEYVSNLHKPVTSYYHLPTINYNNSTLPDFAIVWVHPFWPYHQFISDLMAYVWKKQAEKLCHLYTTAMTSNYMFNITNMTLLPPPIPQYEHYRSSISFCVNPKTIYPFNERLSMNKTMNDPDVNASSHIYIYNRNDRNKYLFEMNPMSLESALHRDALWSYHDLGDGRHKYGFYINSLFGGNISLAVKVSHPKYNYVPSIGIGYLESHGGMGVARVTLTKEPFDSTHDEKILHGLFVLLNGTGESQNTSLTNFVRLCTSLPLKDGYVRKDRIDMPECDDVRGTRIRNSAMPNMDTEIVYVNVELLPVIESISTEKNDIVYKKRIDNRFKIEFIVSC